MREIKFRGKIFGGQWVYGDLFCQEDDEVRISPIEDHFFTALVHSETVGQYTGLKDCNGTELYEGDIVKTDYGRLYKVLFIGGAFVGISSSPSFSFLETKFLNGTKVVGNIHDNPELMRGE